MCRGGLLETLYQIQAKPGELALYVHINGHLLKLYHHIFVSIDYSSNIYQWAIQIQT